MVIGSFHPAMQRPPVRESPDRAFQHQAIGMGEQFDVSSGASLRVKV